jgi:ligand-binding SRPBCC domain-containing protein
VPQTVIQASTLPAAAEAVWARAVTPQGINDELRPLMRMTMPRSMRGRTIEQVPLGERLGRSWILLFGLLPVDYDDLGLAERGPGFRFLERSTMLSMSAWEHERTVTPAPNGCQITDRLAFQLRPPLALVPGSARLAGEIVARLFAHRHRRLARYWAAAGAARP